MFERPTSDEGLIETRIAGETVYDGDFLKMQRDTVRLPDGKTATREFIRHPGAVMIIPLFDDGRVLLERQYRYPLGQVMLEFPAGKLDANEDAATCAHRELREETGYAARELHYLTCVHPVISYSTESIYIYLARGLTAGDRQLDDGEFLETFIAPSAELLEWVQSGRITDVKTIVGAFWLEKILAGKWQPRSQTAIEE